MVDRRLFLSIAAAIVALATGVLAVVISQPALGVVAGAAGVVAGAAGAALAAQLQHTEVRLGSAANDVQRLHRELDAVAAILEEEANRRDTADDEVAPTGDRAFDHTTGLYDERYFAVLVQQQVAAARRSLRPISVVIFEIDGLHGSDDVTRDQALGVVG
ncbi:MAG: hypothetical protein QOH10_1408, partial [Actinomycetota bacterium]|nr:hypothetical protein [Actinomycetota bacterium]